MFGSMAVTETLLGLKHEGFPKTRTTDRSGHGPEEVANASGRPVLATVTAAVATLAAIAGAAGRALGRTAQRA